MYFLRLMKECYVVVVVDLLYLGVALGDICDTSTVLFLRDYLPGQVAHGRLFIYRLYFLE